MQNQNLGRYCQEGLNLGDMSDSTMYCTHLHPHASPVIINFSRHTVSSMILTAQLTIARTKIGTLKMHLDLHV